MGRKREQPTNAVQPVPGSEDQVVGRRFIRLIEDQLAHLRRQPHHGNREVFFDQIVIAHLLAFFNLGLRSLRKIEDVFEDKHVRKHLGTRRLPKSTLSDAQSVFDPALLKSIIVSLQQQAKIQPHDARLDEITRMMMPSLPDPQCSTGFQPVSDRSAVYRLTCTAPNGETWSTAVEECSRL